MTDNRNYGVPDEIAEKLIRRGRDLGYAARKYEEETNAQWLADKQRATGDPLLAWLVRGQAAQKAADEIIAAHSADSVASNCERGECPTCGPDDREDGKLSPEEAAQIQEMLDARSNAGKHRPECGETDGVMADWVTPMAVCSRSPGHWEAIHREFRNGDVLAEWRQVLPGSAWEAARAKRFPSRFGKQARA